MDGMTFLVTEYMEGGEAATLCSVFVHLALRAWQHTESRAGSTCQFSAVAVKTLFSARQLKLQSTCSTFFPYDDVALYWPCGLM